ncbi:MAG: N(4)-(beta-N-acetylglucosaminyl)-L-asparaginase [Chitinophagia bacterium]|jgi:N4-(beta-N-acetylglucosaminyl)-L-asparaginase
MNRRNFINLSSLGVTGFTIQGFIPSIANNSNISPMVVATWDAGLAANLAAWKVLGAGGKALDAVENGVMVTEDEISCCVGLSGNPDRDGHVTLDASIMDHEFNCGSVAFLERIKHPISVARKVMEKTPHVMLVGEGAQQFAVAEGFTLEPDQLSKDAKSSYDNWLKKSEYKPVVNIERKKSLSQLDPSLMAPHKLSNGAWNHDTIGMVALDKFGNLSGSCTTSGAGFKMRGRVGDSPIIGAGLYVDNEVGAVVATGQGEDVIRVAGASAVVEQMRQGKSPTAACKFVIEKIRRIKKEKAKDIQVCFIAINKKGEAGAFALHKGFNYAVHNQEGNKLIESSFLDY